MVLQQTEASASNFVQKPRDWVSDTQCSGAAENLKQQKQMHKKLEFRNTTFKLQYHDRIFYFTKTISTPCLEKTIPQYKLF